MREKYINVKTATNVVVAVRGSFQATTTAETKNVTIKMKLSFFKRRRHYSKLFQSACKCQIQVKFPGVEFLETAPKFRKGKKNSTSFVYVLHKTSHPGGGGGGTPRNFW